LGWGPAPFSVQAASSPNLTYQWKRGGVIFLAKQSQTCGSPQSLAPVTTPFCSVVPSRIPVRQFHAQLKCHAHSSAGPKQQYGQLPQPGDRPGQPRRLLSCGFQHRCDLSNLKFQQKRELWREGPVTTAAQTGLSANVLWPWTVGPIWVMSCWPIAGIFVSERSGHDRGRGLHERAWRLH